MKRTVELSVILTHYLSDEPQPGIVAAQISDWEGIRYTLVDKWPIFVAEQPRFYPAVGRMRVEVLDEQALSGPSTRLLISTEHPFHICDGSGEYASFWVHSEQMIEDL